MKPIKDLYWIEVEKETEDTININGQEMYRDTSYDPMRLARQYGTIYKTPIKDTKDVGIQEGDKVWLYLIYRRSYKVVKPNLISFLYAYIFSILNRSFIYSTILSC